MRVLIVDDDYYIRAVLSIVLKQRGHHPLLCCRVSDAVEMLLAEGCDVALTDLHLPGPDGAEAIPILRELDPGLPIVIMTADPSPAARQRAIRSGASHYLLKPLDISEMFRVLDRASSLRRDAGIGRGPRS